MFGKSYVKLYSFVSGSNYSRILLSAVFQRFGHYGLRSILLVYLITEFGVSDRNAGQIYGVFYGSFFLTALIGGFLADIRLGYKQAASLGICLMLIAQISLALGQITGIAVGLILYSLGYGLFNPNINAAVAEQYPTDENLRTAAYTILYTGVNVGALLGPLICGYIALRMDWKYGFLAGVPMNFLALLMVVNVRNSAWAVQPQEINTQEKTPDNGEDLPVKKSNVLLIMGALVLVIVIFASIFDQLGTSVTLFVHKYVARNLGTFQVPAGYIQSVNPFLVLLFGPLLSIILKKKGEFLATVQGKMKILVLALLLLGIGFLILSAGAMQVTDNTSQVSIGWIFLAILFATLSELIFLPTLYSVVASISPDKSKGFLMGISSATFGIGMYLSGAISGVVSDSENFSKFYVISAGSCLVACLILLLTIGKLKNQ